MGIRRSGGRSGNRWGKQTSTAPQPPDPTVPQALVVTPPGIIFSSAETALLSASAFNVFGTDIVSTVTVTWASTDTNLVTVSPASGTTTIATGVGVGTGVVNCAVPSYSLLTTVGCTVTGVAPQVALSVTVNPSSVALVTGGVVNLLAKSWTSLAGGGTQLSSRTYTFTSSSTTVATVGATGLVTGVAVGAATVTARDNTDLVTGTSLIDVQLASSTHPNLPAGMSLEVATIWLSTNSWKDGLSGVTTDFGTSQTQLGNWTEPIPGDRPNSTVLSPARAGFPAYSGVLECMYPSGAPGGASPYEVYYNFKQPWRRVYMHTWVEFCKTGDTNAGGDFTCLNVQVKQLWMRRFGQTTSGAFLEMKRNNSSIGTVLHYNWNNQSWGGNTLPANQGINPNPVDGNVHEMEFYWEFPDAGYGSPTGILRIWIDNQLYLSYTNATMGPDPANVPGSGTSRFGQIRFEGQYGGGTTPVPYNMPQWWGPVYLYGGT